MTDAKGRGMVVATNLIDAITGDEYQEVTGELVAETDETGHTLVAQLELDRIVDFHSSGMKPTFNTIETTEEEMHLELSFEVHDEPFSQVLLQITMAR